MRIDFEWDPAKATGNVVKHGVTFHEAMSVFGDPFGLSIADPDSIGEERWITIGQTAVGNLLVVVHTWAEVDADRCTVRIISARAPTRREARQYREEP